MSCVNEACWLRQRDLLERIESPASVGCEEIFARILHVLPS